MSARRATLTDNDSLMISSSVKLSSGEPISHGITSQTPDASMQVAPGSVSRRPEKYLVGSGSESFHASTSGAGVESPPSSASTSAADAHAAGRSFQPSRHDSDTSRPAGLNSHVSTVPVNTRCTAVPRVFVRLRSMVTGAFSIDASHADDCAISSTVATLGESSAACTDIRPVSHADKSAPPMLTDGDHCDAPAAAANAADEKTVTCKGNTTLMRATTPMESASVAFPISAPVLTSVKLCAVELSPDRTLMPRISALTAAALRETVTGPPPDKSIVCAPSLVSSHFIHDIEPLVTPAFGEHDTVTDRSAAGRHPVSQLPGSPSTAPVSSNVTPSELTNPEDPPVNGPVKFSESHPATEYVFV
ncbi:MAG: hypothetical protein BWY57_03219 [Betaproteobacteria bacterium ADurb.Bin341]|nr:MAG: hypothetical protein BWY57_03219 [Betaproteobacteria bacterium ADurb.Bin341]